MKSYKLGLSMIVKDEVHVLPRLLESIANQIDYWTIVDTGSTDGTQEFITKFFNDKQIPGKLIQESWYDDFAKVRNIALEDTEENCEFGIWIDADEMFEIDSNYSVKKQLSPLYLTYMLSTVYGGATYTRKNIWKTGENFRWRGVLHELLESPNETQDNGKKLEHGKVIIFPEGNSWKQEIIVKYKKHAEILSKYTEIDKDARWVFYTANSYRDAQMWDEAIEWYEKRASMNEGFLEEAYFSQLMIARIIDGQLNSPFEECLAAYNKAFMMDPMRGETLKSILTLCYRYQKWELMYLYGMYSIRYFKNPPIQYRFLFLELDFYEYEVIELFSNACLMTGRKDEACNAYWNLRKLVDLDKIQPLAKDRIIHNEQHFPKPQGFTMQQQPLTRKERREVERQQNKKR